MSEAEEMRIPPIFRDLSKGLLPITVVASLLVGVFFLGSSTSNYISASNNTSAAVREIAQKQDEQRQQLLSYQQEVRNAISALEKRLEQQPVDVLRKGDLYRFCLSFERLNNKMRCPADF